MRHNVLSAGTHRSNRVGVLLHTGILPLSRGAAPLPGGSGAPLRASHELDEGDHDPGRPGRPHGHRRGQHQVVVVAFSPVLVGVVAGGDVDLDAEVNELLAEERL
jgi:hypothetical protein